MKLIGILARELKAWPESAHLITQDDDGMLNEYAEGHTPRNTFGRAWSSNAKYLEGFADGDDDIRLPLADDFATTIVTRAQWQAAVDALAAQDMHDVALSAEPGITTPAEGSAYGLPPVGVRVTIHDDGSLVYGHGESGEVIAHVEDCAVVRMSYGLGCFMAKALRTDEQIAAEERDAEIKDLMIILGKVPSAYYKDIAEAIQKAGYRKQVAK